MISDESFRDKYVQKVESILENDVFHGNEHKKNFDNYRALGEMAPVASNIISTLPSGKVILTNDVYQFLNAVCDVTNEERKEISFFLYGYETTPNVVEFSEVYSASSERQSTLAPFNSDMTHDLSQRMKNSLNSNLVVCHGHSHPPIGDVHENFSLGDFTSYVEMNEVNSVFQNHQVELMGCLVTSSGDINFVFYDNRKEHFYRFTEVFVKENDNSLRPVNTYGLKQANTGSFTR